MKRILISALALVLSAVLCAASACAFMLPGFGGGKPVTITSVGFSETDYFIQLPTVSSADELESLSLSPLWGCYAGEDFVPQSVTWSAPTTCIDLTESGLQYVPGKITLGSDYVLDQSLDADALCVRCPVYVAGESAAETDAALRAVAFEQPGELIIGQNSDIDDYLSTANLSLEAICYLDTYGVYFNASALPDTSSFSSADTGFHSLTLRPQLPIGFTMPADTPALSLEIGVVDPDSIDLSLARVNDMGYISAEWLFSPKDETSVQLEWSENGGEWQQATRSGGNNSYIWELASYYAERHQLVCDPSKFTPGVEYALRLTYDDGQSSNVLHITASETASTVTSVTPFGGDNDGGDWGGQPFPDYSQPFPVVVITPSPSPSQTPEPTPSETPEPEASPSPSPTAPPPTAPVTVSTPAPPTPAPVIETVTDTSTSLSGARLSQLTALDKTVLFEKQGVALELDSDFLNGLGLSGQDILTVTLEHPTADTFTLSIELPDGPLSQIPETRVSMPWQDSDAALICVDSMGNFVSDATVSGGILTCAISAAGTYRIAPSNADTPSPNPAASASPEPEPVPGSDDAASSGTNGAALWMIPAICAVLGAGLLLARRKRHE